MTASYDIYPSVVVAMQGTTQMRISPQFLTTFSERDVNYGSFNRPGGEVTPRAQLAAENGQAQESHVAAQMPREMDHGRGSIDSIKSHARSCIYERAHRYIQDERALGNSHMWADEIIEEVEQYLASYDDILTFVRVTVFEKVELEADGDTPMRDIDKLDEKARYHLSTFPDSMTRPYLERFLADFKEKFMPGRQ